MKTWNGGKSPIHSSKTVVKVKYRDGEVTTDNDWDDDFWWEHLKTDSKSDIVEYEVIEDHD